MSTEVVMTVVTLFWACVGIVIPVFVQYTMSTSPNKGLIQTMCVLTAFCCYLLNKQYADWCRKLLKEMKDCNFNSRTQKADGKCNVCRM
ncbi:uncharacterized protein LOC106876137 isoform X1 [Octopus bimaculoides]|uniref:uncharacterized protein LOC106876137 isoform X1 n=1 Tax=Octopus bimaculoides TaxID=37653 RepID=UPI0022E7B19D|nr:uncharacterized protein LOC106876137 isoform X1 [Octopus bimaculoides]